MRIYSFVEWEAKAVLLPWSELWSRLTVWRNGIMEGGFVFNWIAIAIYSGLEDVSDQENTAQDWSCKDFSIMVGVDVVRGAIIPLQTYIYIYKTWIDWRWLGQKHSQPILHFNFFKYIYIYQKRHSAANIYIYKEVGVDWRHSTANIYIYRRGRHFTAQLARASRRRYLPRSRTWEGRGLNNYYNNRKTVWMIHCNRKHTVWINIYYYDATDRR